MTIGRPTLSYPPELVGINQAAEVKHAAEIEERDTICGICPAGCLITATLAGGKLTGTRARSGHPLGMICKLGQHAPAMVYSENRLTTPLRRTGPKGTFEFEPISWEEAFDAIVSNLRKTKQEHGAEATAIYTGRGSFDLALCDVFQPQDTAVSSASSILFPFGSPNTFGVGALCYVSYAMIAPHVTMGGMLINMDSEIENSELIVIWGSNPATDSPPLTHQQILAAKNRGADVIVIDPRYSETAKAVEAEWVPVRPGTDGALALAMIQSLIEEDLIDEEFVDEWTIGFDELKQYVQHFRPEVAEDITGVPAETIRDIARRIRRARGASPVMYTGLEYSDSGVQAIRATMILWALAGQLDVPGGRVFRMPQNTFRVNRDGLIANPDLKRAIGRDRFPVYSHYRGESHAISLPESVLEGRPYPIKSLIVLGASIITAWPQPDIWRRTLGALDFLVTIDRQLTADSAYADIVLPAATGFEITSYMTYGPMFKIRERLLEPVGEAKSDFLILAELARRLGYGELYPQSEEEMLSHVLKGSGFTPETVRAQGGEVRIVTAMMEYKKWQKGLLRTDGKPGFETPSGKFEIFSSTLAEHGYDGLPIYSEPGEGPLNRPDLAQQFPLVFNSGARIYSDFRSQHHGVEPLSAEAPAPRVSINVADAQARGICDGDEVDVVTLRGRARFCAHVTSDIMTGSVDANMGGGGPVGPPSWQKCNVNELTDLSRFDPISGFPVYKALLCEVEPVFVSPKSGSRQKDSASESVPKAVPKAARANTEIPVAAAFSGRPVQQRQAARAIYLDHNATTPIDAEVVATMVPLLSEQYGNPSSIHSWGIRAHEVVEASRRSLAQIINTTSRRIVFTGGGSEADNMAIKGAAYARRDAGRHIITSTIEHPAVLASCRKLEEEGFSVTYLPVSADGFVSASDLAHSITPETTLVSVMLANNETGVIQPIAELVKVARDAAARAGTQIVFHSDAVQALGKIPIDVESLGIDLLSLSAHKIHGPKGVGALFVRAGTPLSPLITGGNQEGGRRAGTENVASIAGFAKAAELAARRLPQMSKVSELRDRLAAGLLEIVPGSRINGSREKRLPNTLNMTLPGFRGESLVILLDRMGVALSSGSACKSGTPDPSHALLSLGLSAEEAHCSVRLSLAASNTDEEIEIVLSSFRDLISESLSAVRFVPCR